MLTFSKRKPTAPGVYMLTRGRMWASVDFVYVIKMPGKAGEKDTDNLLVLVGEGTRPLKDVNGYLWCQVGLEKEED